MPALKSHTSELTLAILSEQMHSHCKGQLNEMLDKWPDGVLTTVAECTLLALNCQHLGYL